MIDGWLNDWWLSDWLIDAGWLNDAGWLVDRSPACVAEGAVGADGQVWALHWHGGGWHGPGHQSHGSPRNGQSAVMSSTMQYCNNFIAKCQYNCTRNVLWCQVHASHIHASRKKLNYDSSKQQTSREKVIHKKMHEKSNWYHIKLCISHQNCLFTRFTS